MAAGLSYAGLHPVVAVYATFLNRAFDQLLMDCALHRAGVTVVLDRSGITGPDGASHHGMWDMSISGVVPGLHLAAPRDGQQVARAVRAAVDDRRRPVGRPLPEGLGRRPRSPPCAPLGTVDVLAEPDDGDVDLLLVGIGLDGRHGAGRRREAHRRGRAGARRRPRVGAAGERRPRGPGRRGGPRGGRRGQRRRGRHRLAGDPRRARRPAPTCRWTASASPSASSTTARGARCSTASGSRRMPWRVTSARGWADTAGSGPRRYAGSEPAGPLRRPTGWLSG